MSCRRGEHKGGLSQNLPPKGMGFIQEEEHSKVRQTLRRALQGNRLPPHVPKQCSAGQYSTVQYSTPAMRCSRTCKTFMFEWVSTRLCQGKLSAARRAASASAASPAAFAAMESRAASAALGCWPAGAAAAAAAFLACLAAGCAASG
jgi:hypothetical protein